MDKREFLAWEAASRDTIDVKRSYIDLAGDPIAGILLSQIVFLHLPARGGGSRLDVTRDGYDWIVRQRVDWFEECRLTTKMYDRAIRVLRGKKVVVTKVGRFRGESIIHLRLVWETFLPALVEVVMNSPKGNSGIPQKGIHVNSPKGDPGITQTATPKTQEVVPEESDSGRQIQIDPETLNVGDLFLTASVEEVVRLTRDDKSLLRYRQLHSICAQHGKEEDWHYAYRATRTAMEKSTAFRNGPGAYFCGILIPRLQKHGVSVPVGSWEERAKTKKEIEEFRRQWLADGRETYW